MTVDEYLEMMNEVDNLMQNPEFVTSLLLSYVVMVIVSLLICGVIIKSAKLSKFCILFGLLGMLGIFMLMCMVMAKSAGLSKHFAWFGLLGVSGIMIVAVASIIAFSTKAYKHQGEPNFPNQKRNPSDFEEMFGGRKDEKQNMRDTSNRMDGEQDGYYLNGKFYKTGQDAYEEEDRGKICLNCGSAVEAGVSICPRCKARVR